VERAFHTWADSLTGGQPYFFALKKNANAGLPAVSMQDFQLQRELYNSSRIW
jgi:hypothetical protein